MKPFPRTWILAAALGLLSLSGCVSLASDVTPPPNYVPPVAEMPTDAVVELALPMLPPDPAAGAPIYAEKCLPCHGETGMGDGFQAGNLPNPPPVIGGSELARTARPSDWFAIVTRGNFEKMMPGFSGSLNDRQRWDVVAHTLSLSMSAESLAEGAEIYAANCQDCHGESGRGDGAQATSVNSSVPDWSDPARLAQLSGEELHAIILNGKGDMPAYADELTAEQAWAVVDYTRSLSFTSPADNPVAQASTSQPSTAADATPEATSESAAKDPATLTISGRIVNASGGTVPEGLQVTLLGYDNMQAALEQNTTAGADGSFTFEGLEYSAERVFLATVKVGEYTFNSDVLHATDIVPGSDSPLMLHIYDTTTDASGLVADRMHIFFDFSKEGVVQVGELLIVSNPTKSMIVPTGQGEPVIRFQLPEGATNVTFQDGVIGERYVEIEGGFGDTLSIQPGNSVHQVLFAYELPYNRKLDVTLTPPMAVNATIVILPANGIRLQSDALQDSGEKSMQGVNVHLYTAGPMAAGDPLQINLSGRAGSTAALDVSNQGSLIAGLSALLVALVGVGVWYWRRRKSDLEADAADTEEEAPATIESLVDAIVALDDQYQAGQIAKDAYDARRAELKEQLRVLRETQQ